MFEPIVLLPLWRIIRVLGVGSYVMLVRGICMEILGQEQLA
jgi:hypothetical protein